MSWKVANLCADRRFGSAVRKQIVMFLADKASDDGSGIWCSKGAIKRHTELGETTVKRTINDFLAEGILLETGESRRCKHGYTVVYRLNLDAIIKLNSVDDADDRPQDETGATADPVQSGPPTGPVGDGEPGPHGTPNHPKTIPEPPTRAGARVAEDEDFEKIWTAYPEDRRRNRSTCRAQFEGAVQEGFTPAEILEAVKSYARESEGFTRSKVSFSDNWFRNGKWRISIEAVRTAEADEKHRVLAQLSRLAEQVKRQDWICQHISPIQARLMLAECLVTQDQLDRARVAT